MKNWSRHLHTNKYLQKLYTEEIFAVYGKGCRDSNKWSQKLTASDENLNKQVYVAPSRHGDKKLLLKEGEPSFSQGHGLGKQIKFLNEGKAIIWSGGRGGCGYDELVKVNATVYKCVKDIVTYEPILIEPVGFWKYWSDMKDIVFGIFKNP